MYKKVSIVVSIYNAEKFLEDMLKSLACQTYPKEFLEILLIDDGSKDNSAQICLEFCKENSNFKYIRKENGGVSSARNLGLSLATGYYITFFDSDDTCDKYYVEKMVEAFKDDVQLVCCGILEKTDDVETPYAYKTNKTFSLEDEQSYVDFFNDYWLPVVWNKLYIKDLITFKFEEWITYDEDTVFNLNYLKKVNNIVCLKELLYTYFIRNKGNSLTQIGKKNIFEKSKITNKYRIEISEEIFKGKAPVYVACRKIIKAIFQEVQENYNKNLSKEEIINIINLRFQDGDVMRSFSYYTKIFDQDLVIRDILETKNAEKLYDCALNGFEKYLI